MRNATEFVVGNGRHRPAHQSKIESKSQSTVQSMSPVQSPESRFCTNPKIMDPNGHRQWARPSPRVFILKELNAAECEGLACETKEWPPRTGTNIHFSRLANFYLGPLSTLIDFRRADSRVKGHGG